MIRQTNARKLETSTYSSNKRTLRIFSLHRFSSENLLPAFHSARNQFDARIPENPISPGTQILIPLFDRELRCGKNNCFCQEKQKFSTHWNCFLLDYFRGVEYTQTWKTMLLNSVAPSGHPFPQYHLCRSQDFDSNFIYFEVVDGKYN